MQINLNRLAMKDRRVIAAVLAGILLILLTCHMMLEVQKFNDSQLRLMTTTWDERNYFNKNNLPITPSVEERVENYFRIYPATMAFLIVTFAILNFWSWKKEKNLMTYITALFLLAGIGCSFKFLFGGFCGLTGESSFLVMGVLLGIAAYVVWDRMMSAQIGQFDVAQTQQILEEMGIHIRKDGEKLPSQTLDRIVRDVSSTVFNDVNNNNDVWSLIGEVYTTVNMVELAGIAGAIANGGSSAEPYLVEYIYDPNREMNTYQAEPSVMQELIAPEAARTTEKLWKEATQTYYRSGKNTLDPRISHGKTGTSEIGDGNNRLIMGVMEEYDTAFVVVVKGLPAGDPLMVSIANVLADLIPAPKA